MSLLGIINIYWVVLNIKPFPCITSFNPRQQQHQTLILHMGKLRQKKVNHLPGFDARAHPSGQHKGLHKIVKTASELWYMKELLKIDWKLELEQLETDQPGYANYYVNSCGGARSHEIRFLPYCWEKHKWIVNLVWDEFKVIQEEFLRFTRQRERYWVHWESEAWVWVLGLPLADCVALVASVSSVKRRD